MKQLRLKERLKYFWQLSVGVTLSLMALAWVAYGATYNFYFNNTEQGDNSTATPNVNVSADGQVTGAQNKSMTGPQKPDEAEAEAAAETAAAPAPGPSAAPAPAAEAQPGSTSAPATSVAAIAEPERPREFSRVRLLMGPALVAPNVLKQSSYSDGYSYNYRTLEPSMGAKVELGLFATRDVAFNFFGGGYYYTATRTTGFAGAELEIQPLHLSIGRAHDLINFGIMLGAGTLGRVRDNWVAAHAGARLQFNLGDGWGVAATGRGNFGYLMGDASLVIRL